MCGCNTLPTNFKRVAIKCRKLIVNGQPRNNRNAPEQCQVIGGLQKLLVSSDWGRWVARLNARRMQTGDRLCGILSVKHAIIQRESNDYNLERQ